MIPKLDVSECVNVVNIFGERWWLHALSLALAGAVPQEMFTTFTCSQGNCGYRPCSLDALPTTPAQE